MSVASEFEHAERVVEDVALLQDMAAGKLDERRVRAAESCSNIGGTSSSAFRSRSPRVCWTSTKTVEAWRSSGVLTPVVGVAVTRSLSTASSGCRRSSAN